MRSPRFYVLPLLALAAVACHRPEQPADKNDPTVKSATVFTQTFYDWYRLHDDRLETALAQRPELFGATLLTALRTDIEAQAKNPQEIVGIDWDPFTNSQDPCDPYQVASASRRGDTVLVAMRGMCTDAAPRPGPDVIARLQHRDSSWVFVDFTSPSDSLSLLGHLTLLQKDRKDAAARHRQ